MIVVTYEEKMEYLEQLRQKQKNAFKVDLIECIMEDVRDFKTILEQSKDNYKHWNLFFNGKTGQYLLYLYVDRKSDMLEIDRTLYEKIKEKVGS